MQVILDIETVPAANKEPFLKEARENFKAPSILTKAQAGDDLGLTGDTLKYTGADDVKAMWEKKMAATKSVEVGEENWRKTSLDGTQGRVLCIGFKFTDGQAATLIDECGDEANLLTRSFELINDLLASHTAARKPYFIGHNITFDLKFLFRRAVILGVKPPFQLPFKGRHSNDYFCTMEAWCGYGERISLDNLATALGLEGKQGFDGSMVCDAWLNKEFDKISDYCSDDVELTHQVYKRLNFC